MKKLILHIGSEKTGTTTIQHFCNNNRELLQKQKVFYPKLGFCDYAHFSLIAPFHPADNNGSKLEFAPGEHYDAKQEWQPVKQLFSEHEKITVLISAEHFSSRLKENGIGQLKETINWLDDDIQVEIVFFIRRQDKYFSSWYSTHIKAGGKLSIEDAYKMRFHQYWFYNYFHIAEAWANQFGRQAITIKVFEKEQMPNGLLNTFAETIGFIINDSFNMEIHDDNLSWSPKMLSLARHINEINAGSFIHDRYNKLNKLASLISDKNIELISHEQANILLEKYAESNSRLAKIYLGRDNGRLFFDNEPNYDPGWTVPGEISKKEILKVLLKLLEK